MSVGIRLHDAAGRDFRERAASAKRMGFGSVHLALSKLFDRRYMDPAALTPGLAGRLRDDLAPLRVAVLGCYLNLARPDERTWREDVKTYAACLRFSAWLQAGVVGTETGNPNAEYRFDPLASHTEETLGLFLDRLAPVVEVAGKLGAVLAIEPVWSHIVRDARRARRVLDAFRSPNLQLILDPVNLLSEDNFDRRGAVLDEAAELLAGDAAVLHIKDCVMEGGRLRAVAAGDGQVDWRPFFGRIAPLKPDADLILENTLPENAARAKRCVETLWEEAVQGQT